MIECLSSANGAGTDIAGALHDNRILYALLAFARQVFGAPTASVFSYDAQFDELRFEASAGVGSGELAGARIPATSGIAGTMIQTGIATIETDLRRNANFNVELAARSGYLPDTICAAPLRYDDELLGVIEVLDPQPGRFGDLEVMTILEALADQVSVSIRVLAELRTVRLRNPGIGSQRTRLATLLNTVPEDSLDDGRSGILEAILAEFSRARVA